MKTILICGLALVFAYCLYNLGYHHGRQDERQEIWSNFQIVNGKYVFSGRIELEPEIQVNASPQEIMVR